MEIVDIKRDFSEWPGGRVESDGKFSGERFRKQFLVKCLRNDQIVKVIFDDDYGYGSSFLEEAFGGLVRVEGFTAQFVLDHLVLDTSDNFMKFGIRRYITDAEGD